MTYTIYLLFGLLLGFTIGTFAGFGMAKTTIDEAIVKAFAALAKTVMDLNQKKEKGDVSK